MKIRLVRRTEIQDVSVLWTQKPGATSTGSALAFLVEWPLHGRLLFWLSSGLPVAKSGQWVVHQDDLPLVQQFFASGGSGKAPSMQTSIKK